MTARTMNDRRALPIKIYHEKQDITPLRPLRAAGERRHLYQKMNETENKCVCCYYYSRPADAPDTVKDCMYIPEKDDADEEGYIDLRLPCRRNEQQDKNIPENNKIGNDTQRY